MKIKLANKNRFLACLVVILIIIAVSINIKIIEGTGIKKNEIVIAETTTTYQTISNISEPIKESKIYYNIPLSYELQDYTRELCKKYNVDFEVILSIMYTESEFNHKNMTPNDSENGYSEGLLQINTGSKNYLKWYSELTGIKNLNLKDEKQNIEVGIAVYKFYKDYWQQKGYKDKELLIRSMNSYNCGIEGYKQYIKSTGRISRSYDRKVFKYKEKITELKVIK